MSLHNDRTLVLSEPEQLKAISHQARVRILQLLETTPASAQAMSKSLGMTHGKVGYHVKVLAQAGLIEVIEERPVRAVIEKIYAPTYDRLRYTVAGEDADRFRFMLNQAALEAAVDIDQPFGEDYSLITTRMPESRAAEFAARFAELAAQFGASTETGPQFGVVVGVFKTDLETES